MTDQSGEESMEMPKTRTVTRKLQLTIPMAIAKKLGIKIGDKVNIREEAGRMVITPYRQLIEDLAGFAG